MAKKYHIRDLEEATGIKAHTIRIWEKRYNIIQPDRSETNIRYYDEATFKKFLLISSLYHSNSAKISEISKLSIEEIQEKVMILNPPEIVFETWISDLLLTITEFNNYKFERIIQESVFSFDLERAISDFIFPFLHKIDTLWKGESILLTHKQFAFENIKKFLYNASYAIAKNYQVGEKKIILLTDNDEINSFTLMYADIVLRKRNYDIIFLNQIDDFSLFLENIEDFNTNRILTIASQNPDKRNKLINQIKKHKKTTFYLIDTKFTLDIDLSNLVLINNLDELEHEI